MTVGPKAKPSLPDYHPDNMTSMMGVPHTPHDRPYLERRVQQMDMSGNLNPVADKPMGLNTVD